MTDSTDTGVHSCIRSTRSLAKLSSHATHCPLTVPQSQCLGLATALLAISACASYDPSKHPLSPVEALVTLSSAPTRSLADSWSLVTVRIALPSGATQTSRAVSLTTTAGGFLPDGRPTVSVTADADGHAIAYLKAPGEVSMALMTASVGVVSVVDSVEFARAYPMRVDVDPSAFTIAATPATPLTVTVTLRRDTGTPSKNQLVEMTATDTSGTSIGQFSAIAPTGDGAVTTVRYSPVGSSYRGAVSIRARAASDSIGGVVFGSTTVHVIDP